MTPSLLSWTNWFKPRESKKNFQGGYLHTCVNNNDVELFMLSTNARLFLPYRSQAKVFSCFSLLASMYFW